MSHAGNRREGKGLVLRFRPYVLQLKHAFTLASGSRTTTPVMLTEIEYEGMTGYGEASMPPYLGESHRSATLFLEKVRLGQFADPFRMEEILSYVDSLAEGNHAAKASVDIALHDLAGKILGQPWYRIWGYSRENTPYTSMTIGMDTEKVVKQKVREAAGMKILKVKLGRGNDREMIKWVREVTGVPISVDVNQGWTDKHKALDLIHWLRERGVVFVEQPMPAQHMDDLAWLTERSPLPVMADESVQRLDDLKDLKGVYSGVNLKLMKSTGMREAHTMLNFAHAAGMKVLLGCMTETSCGISAAAQLSPAADWADLDGNLLIKNDPYRGVRVVDGKITLNQWPGIGVRSAS
ncbi:MAG: dipeptide epimerase [Bacteroidota bacterium]